MQMFNMMILGIDVGGTFTDIIMIDSESGKQFIHKVSSIPESQDVAVLKGIREILQEHNLSPQVISHVVHGTTVATNAMLEGKGAKVILLTTEGLEDVIEIGRQNREEIYDLYASRPHPLVKREDRIGVHERISSKGVPIIELTSAEATNAASKAYTRDPEAIAISLLFSFRNPEHEKRLLQEIRNRRDIYAVASFEVLPEFREFERTSTTVLEAYLGPLVVGYLERLEGTMHNLNPAGRLTVMQSNGGTMLASAARGNVIGLAISGLAGGVIGGWQIAKENGIDRAVTLDMGGTSCDVSAIIKDIVVKPNNEVAGFPLRTPSVDVKTIGAGGGSIAWVDAAGILHVGPQSAGASPGPAAYNKGGIQATVTDANLLLGRLNPDYFLGGKLRLDRDRAKNAVREIGKRLNMSVEDAALGITRISTANMVQAIREVTIERGADPRYFVLVPFGGAGPTQGTDIAEALDIDSIIVPPYPGITSALGLICSDLRVDLMRTVLMDATTSNQSKLAKAFKEIAREAERKLIDQGAERGKIDILRSIDMRYLGQSHELQVPLHSEPINLLYDSVKWFESIHQNEFGYIMKERNIEWVTARVTASSHSWQYRQSRHEVCQEPSLKSTRQVILPGGEKAIADVFKKNDLTVGQIIDGPAIIEQLDTTVYIAPNWYAEQKADGTLSMRRKWR
jgi:N-methylhydantoinase A